MEISRRNLFSRALIGLLGMIVLFCLSDRAHGQVFQVHTQTEDCYGAYCRGGAALGSSTCIGHIGSEWYFLTAGHCVDSRIADARIKSCKIRGVQLSLFGGWRDAKVAACVRPEEESAVGDLAILSISLSATELNSRPVAEHAPPVGAEVTMGGFSGGNPYKEIGGKVIVSFFGDPRLAVSVAAENGMSGGPVLCDREVVGVISKSNVDGTASYAPGAEQIRSFVVQKLGRLPDCGHPRPSPGVPPRPEGKPASPTPEVKIPPPVPPAEDRPPEGSGAGQVAGQIAGGLWSTTWGALMPLLGLGGPIGLGIGAAGWLIARKLGPRVAQRVGQRVERRLHPQQNAAAPVQAEASATTYDAGPQVVATAGSTMGVEPVPVMRTVERTKNHYVDVPMVNNEAEALKEAMRLEAEFTRSDKPEVASHLKRVQEMASMILEGKSIQKPGWKL